MLCDNGYREENMLTILLLTRVSNALDMHGIFFKKKSSGKVIDGIK